MGVLANTYSAPARRSRGVYGLNDTFEQGVRYGIASTPNYSLRNGGADANIVNRTMQRMVGYLDENSGLAVNSGGSPVYQDPESTKLYVVRGQEMDNPSLYPLMVAQGNPVTQQSQEPCPCENCTEELIPDTMYLSPVQETPMDKAYNVKFKSLVCESTDDNVTLACEDEIARLNKQGMSGLGRTQSDEEMDCNEKCRRTLQQNGDSFSDAARKCRTICSGNMYGSVKSNPVKVTANTRTYSMGGLGETTDIPVYETTELPPPRAEVYYVDNNTNANMGKPCPCNADNKTWLWVLLGILGVIAVGSIGYYMFRRQR